MCTDKKVVVKKRGKDDSLTDFFEQAEDVLTDLGQTEDHIVGVEVAEGGMVTALSPRLVQHQVPAVYWGQQVLVLPEKNRMNTGWLEYRPENQGWIVWTAGDVFLMVICFKLLVLCSTIPV